jgi:hypothetical protein
MTFVLHTEHISLGCRHLYSVNSHRKYDEGHMACGSEAIVTNQTSADLEDRTSHRWRKLGALDRVVRILLTLNC